MYTRISKGVLIVLNVLGVIAALIIAGVAGDGIAFILALIGIEFLLFFFGMFVELANNILDIKVCLDEWDFSQGGNPFVVNLVEQAAKEKKEKEVLQQQLQSREENKPSQASQAEAVVEEKVEEEVSEEQTKTTQKKAKPKTEWFCSSCGEKMDLRQFIAPAVESINSFLKNNSADFYDGI